MTTVELKYGESGLEVGVPQSAGFVGVLRPTESAAVPDPAAALAASLTQPVDSAPLRRLAAGRTNAVVVISDITRPVPNRLLLPAIIDELQAGGLKRSDILILIATGIHRPNEGRELIRLVGEDIARTCRIENHFSRRDDQMVQAGTIMDGVPVLVNRRYVEADLKILTGFIEPHMWAGYSGGRKSILPGISSVRTLEYMHGPQMIAHPQVVYGKLEGNPFHEAGLQIMQRVGADFIVNVTLNTARELTGVYSGHPVQAHLQGCRAIESCSTALLDGPLDFVLTTNGGAPLDVNLYQTAKAVAGVAPVVKPGGDIVVASRCNEGLGSDDFVRALDEFRSPEEWVQRAMRREFSYPDQWCAHEIFKWMRERTIHLHTEGLSAQQLERYGLLRAASIRDTLEALLSKHGAQARWAVVPDGPYLILRLR
ncbi:MAG: nickel-dependent lactate racemase [Spirochaetaceae bacterium]|nr:MAG: nickel-dependent lactate racemase [Spirochaetaceae bacterium]